MDRTVRPSISNVASLKPESEFEVIKSVLLRESYIQKLSRRLRALGPRDTKVDMALIGVIEVLRNATIDVLEAIHRWEGAQVSYPVVKPFVWNGVNYVTKMVHDLDFLNQYPVITSWLGFEVTCNPFVVPADILLLETLDIKKDSYVIFGGTPTVPELPEEEKRKKKERKMDKLAPYTTPIINDPKVVTMTNRTVRRMRKQYTIKTSSKKEAITNANKSAFNQNNPYEFCLPASTVKTIRRCWVALCAASPGLAQELRALGASSAESKRNDASEIDGFGLDDSFAMSNSVTSFFTPNGQDFDLTSQEFNASLQQASTLSLLSANKAERVFDGPTGALANTSLKEQNSFNVWTPHDVVLHQQAVQKNGGQLYVLTAAGTKGHMKEPWRCTRFQRMEMDLAHQEEQVGRLSALIAGIEASGGAAAGDSDEQEQYAQGLREVLHAVEGQKALLRYQLDQFKKISGGPFAHIDRRILASHAEDGAAVDVDEKLSVSLEDAMATKIQFVIRMKFAKAFRDILIRKRTLAATIIQGYFKLIITRRRMRQFINQYRLATLMQRLYRGGQGLDFAQRLKDEAQFRYSVQLIQRIYRGHRGRVFAKKKTTFMSQIQVINDTVSMATLKPADIDDLADGVEYYLDDHSYDLPIELLVLLRTVMFILNGDDSDDIIIETAGFIEVKMVRARSMGWFELKLLMKRKARFLRRVRAFAKAIKHPYAVPVRLTDDAREALYSFLADVPEDHFCHLKNGFKCATQLYRFLLSVRTIIDLQDTFADYFDGGLSLWYRQLLIKRKVVMRCALEKLARESCLVDLEKTYYAYVSEGRRFKAVTDSIEVAREQLARCSEEFDKYQGILNRYTSDFHRKFKVTMGSLEDLRQSQEIGLVTCKRDLSEYLRTNFIPNEARIKEMHNYIDLKTLELLLTASDCENTEFKYKNDLVIQDFDNIMVLDPIREMSRELGCVEGSLMVLNEVWLEFLRGIGGGAFVYDLEGAMRQRYEHMRAQALQLMARRRFLRDAVAQAINGEIERARQFALDNYFSNTPKTWDTAPPAQLAAEIAENKECARRDSDLAVRVARIVNKFRVPPAPLRPCLLLVDYCLPRGLREPLLQKLAAINFVQCVSAVDDTAILPEMQALVEASKHCVMVADRGVTADQNNRFRAQLDAVVYSIFPHPQVFLLDALDGMRLESWHSGLTAEASFHGCRSFAVCGLLGSARKIADQFAQCVAEGEECGTRYFAEDLRSLHFNISERSAVCRDGRDDVLACTIADLLGLLRHSTFLEWTEESLARGARAFAKLCRDDFAPLCERLRLRAVPQCVDIQSLRTRLGCNYSSLERVCQTTSAHAAPARYLLGMWAIRVAQLLLCIAGEGGAAYVAFPADRTVRLDWNHDVLNNDDGNRVDRIVGEVAKMCFRGTQLLERAETSSPLAYRKNDFANLEAQELAYSSAASTVCVYASGQFAYVLSEVQHGGAPAAYCVAVDVSKIVVMLQPNATEIYEGKVRRYDFFAGKDRWEEVLAGWLTLTNVTGRHLVPRLLRSRYLLLSKLGRVAGHEVRVEVLEEVYGEFCVVVYDAANEGRMLVYETDPIKLNALVAVCDFDEEKVYLENLNAPWVALIHADRIDVRPSARWTAFLEFSDFLPAEAVVHSCALRTTNGPGRRIGAKHTLLGDRECILTVYELSNVSDLFLLRIVLYDIQSAQSAEYRLSPLERQLLFKPSRPLWPQILQRLRIAYCSTHVHIRQHIRLGSEHDGRLLTYKGKGAVDYRLLNAEPLPPRSGDLMSLALGGGEDEEKTSVATAEDLRRASSAAPLDPSSPAEGFGWCAYLHRGAVQKLVGNLTVSLSLHLAQEGVLATACDNREETEISVFVPFSAMAGAFEWGFKERLRKVDESSTLQVLDEVLEHIDVDEGGLLAFRAAGPGGEFFYHIACLQERPLPGPADLPKRVEPSKSHDSTTVDVDVRAAKDLSKVEGIAFRDPYVVVRWNMREIGRSDPVFKTVDPEWAARYSLILGESEELLDCSLEVEVRDSATDFKEESFLGRVLLSGQRLVDFLSSKESAQTIELERSSGLSEEANRHVHGSLVLAGSMKVKKAKAAEAGRVGRFSTMGGWLGKGGSAKVVAAPPTSVKVGADLLDDPPERLRLELRGGWLMLDALAAAETEGEEEAVGAPSLCLRWGDRDLASFDLPLPAEGSDPGSSDATAADTTPPSAESDPGRFPISADGRAPVTLPFGDAIQSGFALALELRRGPKVLHSQQLPAQDLLRFVRESSGSVERRFDLLAGGRGEALFEVSEALPVVDPSLVIGDFVDYTAPVNTCWRSVAHTAKEELYAAYAFPADGPEYAYPSTGRAAPQLSPCAATKRRSDDEQQQEEEGGEGGEGKSKIFSKRSAKFPVESAFVKYVDPSESKVEDFNRVCWQGRIDLKEGVDVAGGDGGLFVSRNSRLLRMRTLAELPLTGEVHYLKEFGADFDNSRAQVRSLPVAFKEVVTPGPRLARRIYRLEILSNTGVKVGSADIDGDDDLRKVAGEECARLYLCGDKSSWDLEKAFGYIVHNRTEVDMKPAAAAKSTLGMLGLGGKKLAQAQSMVSFVRDKESLLSGVGSLLTSVRTSVAAVAESTAGLFKKKEEAVEEAKHALPAGRLRVLSKSHKLAGTFYRSDVFLLVPPEALASPFSLKKYFRSRSTEEVMGEIDVFLLCHEILSGKKYEFTFSGKEILSYIPQSFMWNVDLTSKFRRERFASYVIHNLVPKFDADNKFSVQMQNFCATVVPAVHSHDTLQ